MTATSNLLVEGYLLLPYAKIGNYHGVDRQPFVPILIDDEVDPNAMVGEENLTVSDFYPEGWRREAYRIYEEYQVDSSLEGLDLVMDLGAARKIAKLVEMNFTPHRIFSCKVWIINSDLRSVPIDDEALFGYDVAYPGGDFYSAVLNGLFVNPHPKLKSFKSHLNQNGLFPRPEIAAEYLEHFRHNVPTESESEFALFELHEVN